MTYQQARDAENLSHLDGSITGFISRYSANLSTDNRKTIILFPGGLASQLLRATKPQQNGPPYSYNMAWLDCSDILGSSATQLQMQDDIDLEEQIVIPDGPVEFPLPPPYDGFIGWCNQKQIDYLIFGWDWRRDLSLNPCFFLDQFMPLFEQRVQGLTPDPLQSLYLVGHSEGGMLLKLIMNESKNKYVQLLKCAVTVATPFYGYGGQLPRYFIGDPDIDALNGNNQIVTRLISSLAGGYSLLFLDQATFERDQATLTQDPYYPAEKQYPVLDAITGVPADPYNPQTNGNLVRYPQYCGFDRQMLSAGKAVYDQVAALLDLSVIDKFFNIRGVTTDQDGAPINETVINQTWGWINPNFDPNTGTNPITDYLGPGDGTLPAWSTRFAQTPDANVHDVYGDKIDHMSMMSNCEVLSRLETVIGVARMPETPSDSGQPRLASRRELNRFLAGVARQRESVKHLPLAEQERELRAYVQRDTSLEKQRQLVARAFADALKSPSQKLGTAKAPAEPRGSDDDQ